MKYIELLGLPGSGKTTLLRSFRRKKFDHPPFKTLLSEDRAMILRRFGYRDVGFFRRLKKTEPGGPRPDVFKNLLLDRWQMGIFDEFPELFAQIFLCLKSVRADDRQRAILLNYWRSRTSLYLDVSHSTNPSFCIVDEGLSQTLFSTMTRMSAQSNRKLELVDSVLRCLPSDRTVVMLHTPPEIIGLRSQSGPGSSSEDFSRKNDEIAHILQQQKDFGRDTIELDGSLSVHELCLELSAQINKTSEG